MNLDLQTFLNDMFLTHGLAIGPEPKLVREPQFSFFKNDDGVWTLIEKGRLLGWVNRITYVGAEHKWRAMSAVTHNMEWFYSLDSARCYLFEQSH